MTINDYKENIYNTLFNVSQYFVDTHTIEDFSGYIVDDIADFVTRDYVNDSNKELKHWLSKHVNYFFSYVCENGLENNTSDIDALYNTVFWCESEYYEDELIEDIQSIKLYMILDYVDFPEDYDANNINTGVLMANIEDIETSEELDCICYELQKAVNEVIYSE